MIEMKDRNGSLNQEEVPNLIVFTDMQFDQAGGNRVSAWDTCYQRLEKKYKLLGVEPPRVIFWNLRASYVGNHAPVQSDQKNVQMLSGYNRVLEVGCGDGFGKLLKRNPSERLTHHLLLHTANYLTR